ncbi:MAG: DUF1559 domain-containing protein [Gemmataceae bacterium]|nr:DUF1559 domain-containing protein [Gemmataceae bacterium]
MTNMFRGTLLAALGVVLAATLSIAAPAAKPKEEKLEPPTAKQFASSANNLKQIGLAIHNFASANQDAPPTNVYGKDKKALLSWRVQLLPYLEEEELYKKFKLDEPWDSEHNKKLIDKLPKIYAPIRVKAEKGLTFYQGFMDTKGVILTERFGIGNIPDGTSNTFAVAESGKPVIWTKPSDIEFDGKNMPVLGGMFDGKFHALLYDGSVNRYRKGLRADLLAKLIDPADGLVVDTIEEDYDK